MTIDLTNYHRLHSNNIGGPLGLWNFVLIPYDISDQGLEPLATFQSGGRGGV